MIGFEGLVVIAMLVAVILNGDADLARHLVLTAVSQNLVLLLGLSDFMTRHENQAVDALASAKEVSP
ncbi:hypothetical protein AAULR_17179 [Lacticaseibacillus rhamnosus MTCC 5462]|nr:hypothetical protein AAULR_17179 [Lacticaseibacillus rhamnosus MTCC 5462]